MPPRRTFRRSARRARRRTQWVDTDLDAADLAIGTYSNVDLLGNYRAMDGAETAGITVLRTHARLWVTNNVTIGDGIAWAFIVSDLQDLATGQSTSSGLNPILNPYAQWMLYQKWNAHPTYSFHSNNNQFEIDLKSKRRVPFGDTYMASIVNVDAAAALDWALHVRTLIALS